MPSEEFDINKLLYSNIPLDEFKGLSPTEVHELIYDPLGKRSIIRFNEIQDNSLDKIPFFRLTEYFLKIVHKEGFLKLTKNGALPVKVVKELYNAGFIKEVEFESGLYKLTKESDSKVISAIHINSKFARLVKYEKDRLVLTRKAEKLLKKENRQELFKLILDTFFNKFNIGYQDSFSEYAIGQMAWGYSLYLLHKLGNDNLKAFDYGQMFLEAFPKIITLFEDKEFRTPEEFFLSCYTFRFFHKIMAWFGFIEPIRTLAVTDNKIVTTGVIQEIFRFDTNH
jgi:hypothetical protein